MQTIQAIKILEKYPTFNISTLADILNKDNNYAKVYLNRMKNKGMVHKIQRNVYTVNADPLIVASGIIWPSYISLWEALHYHGLTEQISHEICVLTTCRKGLTLITTGNTRIRFKRIMPKYFFGFSKVYIKNFEVFMAEPEKAIIDAALFHEISFSEIYFIVKENKDKISGNKIIDYVCRIKNGALAKRFGWMLENLGYKSTEKLRALSYETITPLDYAMPHLGTRNQKWNVIVNIKEL